MSLFHKASINVPWKQFIRFRSQRRSLGKPPGVARTLQQRLEELNYKDPNIYYKVDIGFKQPSQKRREVLINRSEQIKQNRAHLEELARKNKLLVPLKEIKSEWNPSLISSSANHYGVFNDLFGDAYFNPVVDLTVSYNSDYQVHWGNHLTPTQCKEKPQVSFKSKSESLWLLTMTSPDGHLTSPQNEYILWMVGNIRGGDLTKGEEIVPYMQPFPIQGLGLCRYVFVLYKQNRIIDFSAHLPNSPNETTDWTGANSRDFSTESYYRKLQDDITPAGLCFFQAEWDNSVTQLFHKGFKTEEPRVCYDFGQHYNTKQTWFPLRQPFNLYLDRYRDEKQIAKEHLVKRLKDYSPWTGHPAPVKFPNAIPFSKTTPSWLKNEIRKQRLKKARYHDD